MRTNVQQQTCNRENVLIEMLLLVRRAQHHDALIGEKTATINVERCTNTRTEFEYQMQWVQTSVVPVHFCEQLIDGLICVWVNRARSSLAAHRVDLVNEHHTRSFHFCSSCSTTNKQTSYGLYPQILVQLYLFQVSTLHTCPARAKWGREGRMDGPIHIHNEPRGILGWSHTNTPPHGM